MQTITKSTSSPATSNNKKQILYNNQNLTKLRCTRLRNNKSLLGQPDIIVVTKIKIINSFFTKQKKQQQCSQYFVNGITFPTTAHFSTYISSKYQNTQNNKSNSNISIKAKLIMFDAFQQKDIHVEINIPGSLQIKVFNLSGQALKPQQDDYLRAYFSSYLRSLKPMNYPNILLNPYIYKVQIHKQILKKIIPFCFQNSLRQLKYIIRPIFTSQLQQQYDGNMALQIILNYVTKYRFWNLIDIIIQQLQQISKQFQIKDLQYINNKIFYLKKQYRKVLVNSSQILLQNPTQIKWKQIQIECLYKVKNYNLIKNIGQNIIRKGGTHTKIYKQICMSYLETKDYKHFIKVMNSILTLYNEQQVYIQKVSHITKKLYSMDISFNKGQNISFYPQLCFQFNNQFLNRQNKLTQYKQILKQNQQNNSTTFSKQDPLIQILNLIQRIDQSLQYSLLLKNQNQFQDSNNLIEFYNLLVKFQKLKGWAEIIKIRGECFWLQSDFKVQQQTILDTSMHNHSTTSIHSAMKNSSHMQKSNKSGMAAFQTPLKSSSKSHSQNFMHIQMNQLEKSQLHQVEFQGHQTSIEEDSKSQQSDDQDIQMMPACSKRVSNVANTTRRNFLQLKKTTLQEVKVLCCMNLQKLFVSLYEDLKLQIELEKWTARINFNKLSQISPQRRELLAIVFLKKAFLHLKLQRFKKCEQTLKLARKISQSVLVYLISSYQLILLYIKTNSMKGVQFYIVDLIKIFNIYGVKKFDIVPEWAKDIITYIIQSQGIGILNKLTGPFRQLMVRWLRNNYSENFLLKKQNNTQTMFKQGK